MYTGQRERVKYGFSHNSVVIGIGVNLKQADVASTNCWLKTWQH